MLEGLAAGSTEASEGRGDSDGDLLDDSGAGCAEEVLTSGIVADMFTGCREELPMVGIRGGCTLEELYDATPAPSTPEELLYGSPSGCTEAELSEVMVEC